MKIRVMYYGSFDAEVPAEEFYKIYNSTELSQLDKGDAFNRLITSYNDHIVKTLDLANTAEIGGIYNPFIRDPKDKNNIIFCNDDDVEVYWSDSI